MAAPPPGIADGYWAVAGDDLLRQLQSRREGLSSGEATERLRIHDPNRLEQGRQASRLRVLVDQLRSPLLLLLVFAALGAVRDESTCRLITKGVEGGGALDAERAVRGRSEAQKRWFYRRHE